MRREMKEVLRGKLEMAHKPLPELPNGLERSDVPEVKELEERLRMRGYNSVTAPPRRTGTTPASAVAIPGLSERMFIRRFTYLNFHIV